MTKVAWPSFNGKRVLITGHTGFKGAWLCQWLHAMGATVCGIALDPPTTPSLFNDASVADLLTEDHRFDIRDSSRLCEVYNAFQPDLVMHLAAVTVVRHAYANPLEAFAVNTMGTSCVLEAVRLGDQPCAVVCVTSDKCYLNREQAWGYREDDTLGDLDPYGASKGAAELVIAAYRRSYFNPANVNVHGVRLASVRAGNVIGGGDYTEHALMVDTVNCLIAGRPVTLRSPNAVRPWQHVLQALDGYLTVAEKLLTSDDPQYCTSWNIGPLPGGEWSVREVVQNAIKYWGDGEINEAANAGAHEATLLRLSIDKAMWHLNWRPGWNTTESVQHTVDWYLHRDAGADAASLCAKQIAAYPTRLRSAALAVLDEHSSVAGVPSSRAFISEKLASI